MKQVKHFTHAIQFKFLLLRLFIALVIILVSGTSIWFVQKIAHDSSAIIENQVPLLQEVQDIHAQVLSAGLQGTALINVIDLRASTDQETAYSRNFKDELQSARTALSAVTSHPLSSPEVGAYVERLLADLSSFEEALNDALTARDIAENFEDTGTPEEVDTHAQAVLKQQEVIALFEPLTQTFAELEDYLVSRIDAGVAEVNESTQSNQILISLVSLLAVLLTLLVGLVFSKRTIVQPLQELTASAEEMANGKLTRRVDISSRDEIGKLAYTFNKMASQLQTSYDDLEKIVKEKTEALEKVLTQFENKNEDLEKSQMATINLLEDLEEEKRAVEERVKQRTAELEREKNKLLQVTSNMRGGGILLDDEQEVVFVNDEAYSLLGLPKNTPFDTILANFLSHFDDHGIKAHFKKCIEGNTFHVPEIESNERVFEIFFHHLQDNGETNGYFILWFDITDAKLLERSKSELVAVASHQLRTPLTAMRGNVEMLIDESFGALNTAQHELLDDIEVSTIRLITMVNEMLDITKIERGDLEMHMEQLNVREAVTSVVDDLQTYASRHEFVINVSLPTDIVVEADRVRLRQVFQNLVDNAIKYSSHPGKLDITAVMKDHTVELQFKDNGIGIPKNEQPKLFERFYRASNTAKTASSGSGLGLYIVKSIAKQLGGDIRFESVEGSGSTFFVTLPLINNNVS